MATVLTDDGLQRLFASMEQTSQALTSNSEPEERKALLIALKQQIDRADQLLSQQINLQDLACGKRFKLKDCE